MPASPPRLLGPGLAILVALGWGCGSKQTQTPTDWVASLESVSGEVQVTEAPGAQPQQGKKGLVIRVGGRLTTAAKSEAVLVLRNGGRLTIKPDSVVLFESSLPAKQLALALERGAVEGKSGNVEASELVIGVGERKVRLTSAAAATVSAKGEAEPKVFVSFGAATVEDPDGKKQKLLEGKELVLTSPRAKPRPDAGPASRPSKPDARTVVAPELVYYLRAGGKGKVLIRRPGETRFTAVKRGEPIAITPGTELKLTGKASVTVGADASGGGTAITGPAQLVVQEGPKGDDGRSSPRLESTGDMTIQIAGPRGKAGPPLTIEGVKITTRVTHRRIDLKLKREKGRTLLVLAAGEASLVGKDRNLRLEAGQDAVLSKGKITGPNMPPAAPLQIQSGGTMRVFAAGAATPVTFRWNPEGGGGALVEVSRSQSFANPLFSDIIQRRSLTTLVGKGAIFWQVRPVDGSGAPAAKGTQGKLVLLKDTSHRVLKGQAPKNTIQESFGNTTVYYQNTLPRFTFRWESMGPGTSYQLKIFREQNLSKPIHTEETKGLSVALPPGKLAEGTFIWYVVGKGGSSTRTPQGRRLSIKYDNATPDLQIIYPPNGAVVSGDLEAKGVTIPGSKVLINGQPAALDESFRFAQPVKLKPGPNQIIFLVIDPRRGASYYLRQVTRR